MHCNSANFHLESNQIKTKLKSGEIESNEEEKENKLDFSIAFTAILDWNIVSDMLWLMVFSFDFIFYGYLIFLLVNASQKEFGQTNEQVKRVNKTSKRHIYVWVVWVR